MTRLLACLLLPREITTFERTYLARMNRVALAFFAAHVPLFTLLAALNDTGPILALGLTALMVAGPAIASQLFSNPRHVSATFGFTAMCLGGLLVHVGQGPMQIEMHFYFFVLIALLAVFANPVVILVAAATVTLHHLLLWLLVPSSVFNYDASFWTVVVHALFVVVESVAACFVARSFFDNVIGLERIVARRTDEIAARNRQLRQVFDNVEQGFLTIDKDGVVAAERSSVLARWLGEATPGATIWAWIAEADPRVAAMFRLGWEAVLDNFLPLELCLEQMPTTLVAAGRTLRFAYTPIVDGKVVTGAVVMLTDVTAEVERARADAEQRDLLAIFERLLRDRLGVLQFLSEGDALLDALSALSGEPDDLVLARRLVHTLKGNAPLFGLARVAAACQALEDRLAETHAPPTPADLAALQVLWIGIRSRLASLLRTAGPAVDVSEADYADLFARVERGAGRQELLQTLSAWKREPSRRRLSQLGEHAEAIASRLGKGRVEVEVSDGGVRLDGDAWAPFWSACVHLVRNAVDHGLERPEERRLAGKHPHGRIGLATRVEGDAFLVEIRDDGGGVAWGEVSRRAEALALRTGTPEDLSAALCHDGLTTRTEVGEYSGRGVGISAVAAICRDRGGSLSVESRPGEGTAVTCRFPLYSLAA